MPFWGDPALLFETVDSVRAQRDRDWRLIVIDDCYPDDSVPAYFAATRRRAHHLRAQRGESRASPRTTARRSDARPTEYITILGCDDLMHPNYVDVVRRTIAAVPDADVIQPGVAGDRRARRGHPTARRSRQAGPARPARRQRDRGADAASAWRRASSAATGSTGRRSRSAPRRSGASTSATACRSSRTSRC